MNRIVMNRRLYTFLYPVFFAMQFSSACFSNYSNQTIKNINVPSCKNCIYYKQIPLDMDFTSTYNKCAKFGTRDVVTDTITYDYADLCRNNESKCGHEDKHIGLKVVKHTVISTTLNVLIILIPVLTIVRTWVY